MNIENLRFTHYAMKNDFKELKNSIKQFTLTYLFNIKCFEMVFKKLKIKKYPVLARFFLMSCGPNPGQTRAGEVKIS